MSDYLVKAIGEGVRVFVARTTAIVNEAISRHGLYPLPAAALGRTMTGALLFAANLKNKEAITISIRGNGRIGSIVADATEDGFVRGYVGNPKLELPLNAAGKLDVSGAVGEGLVTVTRFTGMKAPMSSSAEIVSGEIAEDLTNYLYASEQTASSVGLGVLVGTDLRAEVAGGFMVQLLPDATDQTIVRVEANLQKISQVTSYLKDHSPEDLARVLLDGFNYEILTKTDLAFKCHCSKERIEDVLISMGVEDLDKLIADGKAEVVCHFCGEKYQFKKDELTHIRKIVANCK